MTERSPDGIRWWLERGDEQFGPFSSDEVRRFQFEGRLGAHDRIRRHDEEEWRPVQERVAELGLSALPTPVVPPTERPPTPPPPPERRNTGLELLLPVNRSPLAIIAPYIGLLSLGCAPLGPVAVIVGIFAWRNIKPGKAGRGRALTAIVLGAIGTLLLIFVSLSILFST